MATKPAGGTAYGDLDGYRGVETPGEAYRNYVVVNTPLATYTVAQLVDLINAAVGTASAVDSTGFGLASR